MSARQRPMLIYSQRCRSCVRLSKLARLLALGALELRAAEMMPHLPPEWQGQLVLCLPDGRARIGSAAVFRALPGALASHLIARGTDPARPTRL